MNYCDFFRNVIKAEADALRLAADRIEIEHVDKLERIFIRLRELGGNLVFSGVGKSGLIGKKISSTFSSLGLPSYFLHPTEALHGDLGKLSKLDVMVVLSNSGSTDELLKVFPYFPMGRENVIGLLGNMISPIAQKCAVVLNCGVEKEACIHNQAPTTSTTVALAVGDAMAVLYEHIIQLSKEGFAQNHPGGLLGKSLNLKVESLMINREDCPMVRENETLQDVIFAMTRNPAGMCAVLSDDQSFIGIIVEGDIRRFFAKINSDSVNPLAAKIDKMINRNPITVSSSILAYEALKIMEDRDSQISVLPVVEDGQFVGMIRLHDLLKEGFSFTRREDRAK